MAYFPFQPGQQPMSSSQGVVIASDQSPVSVVGTVGINPASVQLLGSTNVIGSVATLQGTNPWVVQLTSGSVITAGGNSSVQVVGTMPPQSVSGVGTFNINPVGNGSIIATLVTSSVTALQGTNPWVIGNSSVQVVGLMPSQSVSGVGNFNVVPVGSIAGTYLDTTAVTSVTGVAILFKSSDTSSVMHAPSPSFPLPIVGSVSGTVTANPNPASVQLLGGTNAIGSVAVLQGTNPWIVGNSSVLVVGLMPPQSVSGVGVFNIAGSVAATGSVTTLQGTNPWVIGNSSVMLTAGTNTIGSVVAIQGTNPYIVQTTGSTITFMQGSVAAFQGGTWNVSIVGTRAASAVLTSVKGIVTTVTLLASNADRKGATVYNTAGTAVYLNLGTTAQTSVYTVGLNQQDYYEVPFGYTGAVAGITASNAGLISISELT